MLTIQKVKDLMNEAGEDSQKIDFSSYSPDVSLEDFIRNEYPEFSFVLNGLDEQAANMKALQLENEHKANGKNTKVKESIEWDKIIPKLKNIFVTGDLGTAKTSFSYSLLENLKKYMPIYVFKHPDKMLIHSLGFKNLYSIDEIESLNKIAVFIDEPQLIFPKYEKRGSIVLNKLLSLSRQKDIILIISTSDTRYITSAEEFYISTYIIKKIDYQMIKRGSKIKNIIEDMAVLTPSGFADEIKINEFIFYNRELKEINGKYDFMMPKYFDERLSKPYGMGSFPKQTL